ncbi:protein NRT1/ PTR FAMILY 4.5-like [Oryza brachyantha]|uniref:protein NRT1/ PTR FAMILY 4.5-like n=1 Tax=Oryza brachyantha TaxID=4533 RepID=UPI001AD9CF47|nr:protein NRT1/ PTR FAMILY 4.5-like [Oryza brachyantha]XP_040385059.1 protein NRT1/ PTR FAMILY 4.5-like [Oryza brachyantha]XP_040385060.1 protein NRT1/ PTR FAMILY 4.5-like [Oryza brachyantha]
MGSSSGLVDWRGRPVDTKKHGGVRASIFIHMLVWLSNVANIGNMTNLVSYLNGRMNMGVAQASTTSTGFVAMMQVFTIPAAFLADSYLKRLYTILFFAPVQILGYIILAIQAHVPSLHPAPCPAGAGANHPPGICEPVHGGNLSLLMLGLYLICVGEGAVRACLPALGGDQFDEADAAEQRQAASFFNWYTFAVSLGAFVGLVLVVWVQDYRGWDAGFAVCAAVVLLGLLVWAAGIPTYRNKVPAGSPITRIMQVLVVAFKKRNLQLPSNPDELYQPTEHDSLTGHEILQRTPGLKCLDKAAIVEHGSSSGGGNGGGRGAWSLCSVWQVEETKIVARMVPIFLTATLGYMPVSVILTFTVQQGNTMDTRLGRIRVSPAMLFAIPTVFQMAILVVYDRAVVPALRRATGRVGGVTHLQRIGVGFVFSMAACAVAAAVEARRRSVSSPTVPMSVFWLTPQFFLLGVVDVTSFVGLLEFFSSEASDGMKSIGSSIFYCMVGLAAWLNTMLIELVNRATRRAGAGGGWLDGADLNRSRLDRFYWLVCGVELVAFVAYLLFAWRYVYRNDQRVAADGGVHQHDDMKPASAGVDLGQF